MTPDDWTDAREPLPLLRVRALAASVARRLGEGAVPPKQLTAVLPPTTPRSGWKAAFARKPPADREVTFAGWSVWRLVMSTHERWNGRGQRRTALAERWRISEHFWLTVHGQLLLITVDGHQWFSNGRARRAQDILIRYRTATREDLLLPDRRWRAPHDFAFDPGGEGLYFERRAWIAKGGPAVPPAATLAQALETLERALRSRGQEAR
jgi:hypothetical protein